MRFVFRNLRSNACALLVVSAAVQTLCATYFLSIKGFAPAASLLFIGCQLLSVVFLLYLPLPKVHRTAFINPQLAPKLLAVAALLPVSYQFARSVMDGTPLRIEYADMLPIIGVMCQRFLSGQFNQVYQPIPEVWSGIRPIYLPAMWLPFCASFLFGFDMRWMTVCGIWGSVLLCVAPLWRSGKLIAVFAASLLVLLLWLYTEKTNNVIRLTEEGVVFFYYSLLTVSLFVGNAWLIGIAAALCLLSRYAIIGWLPFALLVLLHNKQYKFLMKAVAAGIATAALLVLPFGTGFLQTQAALPSQYIAHAQRVWSEQPQHFTQSLGLAKFFGPHNAGLLHGILVWGTFAAPALFFLAVNKKRFSTLNLLLAGLQLSLCLFYNFIDVPYLYLFYTPVFVSLVMAGWAMSAKNKF